MATAAEVDHAEARALEIVDLKLGFRVQGLRFRVFGGLGFKVLGFLGFRVLGLRFKV